MRNRWQWIAALLIGVVLAGCCSRMWRWVRGARAGDCVYVHRAPLGEQWRLVFDGIRSNGTELDNELLVGNSSPQHVGRIHPWSDSNVVAAFCRRRPPKIVMDAAWTIGNDDLDVKFNAEIEIDIAVWIVHGPYDVVELTALDAIKTARTILGKERMGVRFGDVAFHDATANTNTDYLDFKCESACAMESDIGSEDGKINIYFVRSVYPIDGDTSDSADPEGGFHIDAGSACGTSDFVVVGSSAGDTLLVHELGHCLWLDHTNAEPGFDATNVMWSTENDRAYLTEGQVFRAHLLEKSAINRIYEARPGEPALPASGSGGFGLLGDTKRLPLAKRLFADGPGFPPN